VDKKTSTAHNVRARSRKEESNYELAILAAASLSASLLCIAGAEIVVFHIALILATAVVGFLLAATSLLATLLSGASRRLLAKILVLIMTGTTHVSLEIVLLHSVICHVYLPPMCSMVNSSTGVSKRHSSDELSNAIELFNTRAIYDYTVNRIYSNRECSEEFLKTIRGEMN
jgi:hypothetical protein